MTIQEMLDKKGRLVTEADQILQKAKEEGRYDLSAEENTRWEAIHADVDKISAFVEKENRMAKLAEPEGRRSQPVNPEQRVQDVRQVGNITDAMRTDALRTWARAGAAEMGEAQITDAQRANAVRCGLDPTKKAITLRLFAPKALKSAHPEDVRSWREETRAALTGAQSTTTTGGYTVADAAMQSLEVALLAFGGMRQVSTIIRTATGGPLPIPTVNDTTQKGRLLSENTGATETENTFGQVVLDSYKYSSDYILASVEFMNDSSIDVSSFLGTALGTRIARLQNDHFTTGTGSSQPNGVVVAAASGVTSVADPPIYDNFVDLLHSVDPAYRANARFMMNDTTLKTVKKIKVLQYSGDTTGYPLWSPGLTFVGGGMASGQPDTILGFPYIINQSMASPGSSAKKVLFGDFSKYMIRDVVDVTLLRLDERFAELHQVAFLAFARSDGDLIDAGTHPIKYMSQA